LKDAEAEETRLIEESDKKYREQLKQKRLQQKSELDDDVYICECCEYKTRNIDSYEAHLETKEHKVKQHHADWFCECCNTQSRSKNEHEFHLKSTKHQKNAGLIPPELQAKVYRCDLCDYETSRSDHYKLHLTSKKHMNNK
jgi:hypothetical protein